MCRGNGGKDVVPRKKAFLIALETKVLLDAPEKKASPESSKKKASRGIPGETVRRPSNRSLQRGRQPIPVPVLPRHDGLAGLVPEEGIAAL